ncbi:MAG: ParB N-terminal domain-containing protein [Candidatus Aureabacteria bacterium]|nr:ParB N-terminal domain-containing protein [Candidatus Auribacterota bacterium]
MKIPMEKIVVDEEHRIRKEAGDLAALAGSIGKIGLLNPIVVDEEYRLIAGSRRLQACRNLGWKEIEAQVIPFRNDLLLMLDAEVDENLARKDFTPEEIIGIEKRRQQIIRMMRGNIFQRIWRWVRKLWMKIFPAAKGKN